MKIHIYTNNVAGGWMPDDIDQFLGGGEEVVVLLAEAFVRAGYAVNVYHNTPEPELLFSDSTILAVVKPSYPDTHQRNGVLYLPREKANFGKDPENEILITWKDSTPIVQGASVFRNIHFSSDVEGAWPMSSLNHFVNMSNYQQARNVFVPGDKSVVCPLGVDLESLDSNRVDKIPNTMLYCSSPDRGLVKLVQDWKEIKKFHPDLLLKVAYGFKNYEANERNDPRAGQWRLNLIDMMDKEDGIEYLGQLTKDQIEKEYWKAEYWCLPLQRPDSELFCLNAIKARYCECIPVINKVGALKNTVGSFINYVDFLTGTGLLIVEEAQHHPVTWDKVVADYWLPLFRGPG